MDGIHDLGGMQGFGPVVHSRAEPAFPDRWQAVARALMAVVAGAVQASGASSGTRLSGWSQATT